MNFLLRIGFFLIAIIINLSCSNIKNHENSSTSNDEFLIQIDSFKNELKEIRRFGNTDSLFRNSPILSLAIHVDRIYDHYFNLVDTSKNLNFIKEINSYINENIDVDSILKYSHEYIQLINNDDNRVLVKFKIIHNQVLLLNEIKKIYETKNEISEIRLIRINPSVALGEWKKLVAVIPKGFNIVIDSDSLEFFGYEHIIYFADSLKNVDNDSICFSITKDSIRNRQKVTYKIKYEK